jgi:hypothetical protein
MQEVGVSDDRQSRLYVLRLWREHSQAPLRLALRRAGYDDPIGFADLDALMAFLADEAEAWEPPAAPPEA